MQPSTNGSNALAIVSHETAVQTYFGGALATLQEVMLANRGPRRLFTFKDIQKVKFPGAGSLTWNLPGIEGKPTPVEEIEGVILAWQEHRGYYASGYEGGNEAPDCWAEEPAPGEDQVGSHARVTNKGVTFGGACATCPIGRWRIEEGGKKIKPLCRPRIRVYIQTKLIALPIWIDLPSTSVKPFNDYMDALTRFNMAHFWVVTRFALKTEQAQIQKGNKTQKIDYAVLEPRILRHAPAHEGDKGAIYIIGNAERTEIAVWRAGIQAMIDPVNRAAMRAAQAEAVEETEDTQDEASAAAAYGVDEDALAPDESQVSETM